MIEKLFAFMNDIDNYDDRKVGRNTINGLIVSTCYTSDMGYETAILDQNGVHPVERYRDRESAINGHIKWCNEAKTIKEIIQIGWFEELDDFIKSKLVTVRRYKKNNR